MRDRGKGLHLIVDAVATRRLDDRAAIRRCIRVLARVTGLTLRRTVTEVFSNGSDFGHGITGIGILSESSIVFHTSPECGMLNVDIYSCKAYDTGKALATLTEVFGIVETKQVLKIDRY
jgi:S-adenosylmethionine decarboxylase